MTQFAIDIIREVAAKHGVPVGVVRSRKYPVVLNRVRREIYVRLREERKMSNQEIGIMMGNRHGGSVSHAVYRNRGKVYDTPFEIRFWNSDRAIRAYLKRRARQQGKN